MMSMEKKLEPAYRRIKAHLLEQIHSGKWQEGQMIPTEQDLARQFGVARMTANRALRELTDEQVLMRIQGSGTYVAQQKYQSTLVEIQNIATEIASRGHTHRSELHQLERIKATAQTALQFDMPINSLLFHSVVVHFENNLPIQVEDRLVNPSLAPDYLSVDLSKCTANEYLMNVAPLEGMQYRIEAQMPPKDIADMLHISSEQPCLILKRKTLSLGQVASTATLWHPANRYQFTGGA